MDHQALIIASTVKQENQALTAVDELHQLESMVPMSKQVLRLAKMRAPDKIHVTKESLAKIMHLLNMNKVILRDIHLRLQKLTGPIMTMTIPLMATIQRGVLMKKEVGWQTEV